jgi:simple sugar transport system permease protein
MSIQVEQPPQTKPVRTSRQQIAAFARRNSLQLGIIAVLALMWVFFILAAPRTFQATNIYEAFFQSVPFYGIIALPITLLVIAQEIDLSFGSIMAISVVSFVAVFKATSSPLLALIACLATGLVVGLINGLIVVKIGIPALIATIGTQFFWRGVVLVVTNARSEQFDAVWSNSPWLREVLVGRLPKMPVIGVTIPMQMIWMIFVAILVWVLLNRHRFGAHIYLIGDNINSARLMGINTDLTRIGIFAVVGVSAALAGLLACSEISNYFPSLGDGYLLKTLAAVFLGGTPVLGGTGTILGTFIGCFIIGAIEPGTVAIGLTGFWTNLIYGLIIVVSVSMHTVLRRRMK